MTEKEFRELFTTLPATVRERLPAYDALNKEFNLDGIEEEKQPLLAVAKRVGETFDHYARLVEGVLMADNQLTSMQESGQFTDEEKERLIRLLKQLMFGFRAWQEQEFLKDEAGLAQYVQESYDAWRGLKSQLHDFLKRLKESWQHNEEFRPDVGYLG